MSNLTQNDAKVVLQFLDRVPLTGTREALALVTVARKLAQYEESPVVSVDDDTEAGVGP